MKSLVQTKGQMRKRNFTKQQDNKSKQILSGILSLSSIGMKPYSLVKSIYWGKKLQIYL